MNERFLLIAYKPDSVDMCRGCRMASYSADFAVKNMLTVDQLVDEWAEYLHNNLNLDCNEAGYDFWIFKDGIKVWDQHGPYWDGAERYGYNSDDFYARYDEIKEQEMRDEAEIQSINERAQYIAMREQQEQKDAEIAKAKADKEKAEAMAKEKRRQEFERLQQEFGPTA